MPERIKTNHYLGGYFIVEQATRAEFMSDKLLPKSIYTPSECICDLHPNSYCLSWVRKGNEELKEYQKKLNLSDEIFNSLCKDCEKYFNENKYGWENMFLDLNCLLYFKDKYFKNIPNLKILTISTTEKYKKEFLEEEVPLKNHSVTGVYSILQEECIVDIKKGFLGYEILGFEYGSFHSFICNSLETDLNTKLDIELNQYGKIDDYETACKGTEYVNNPEIGAEPVLWQPWAINEI